VDAMRSEPLHHLVHFWQTLTPEKGAALGEM
jgi:hypothetical protein